MGRPLSRNQLSCISNCGRSSARRNSREPTTRPYFTQIHCMLSTRLIWCETLLKRLNALGTYSIIPFLDDIANFRISDYDRSGLTGSSVTSLSFISAERNHLLVTASEVSTALKVWDIRSRYSRSSSTASVPVSTTDVPESHKRTRNFGTTSLAINSDSSKLYALSWDSVLYAYATSHLILGQAPELKPTKLQNSRFFSGERPALGPIYGFKHPKLRVSSFFVKCALRRANNDKPELIATGSGEKCPILFSTDERDFPAPRSQLMGAAPFTKLARRWYTAMARRRRRWHGQVRGVLFLRVMISRCDAGEMM